MTIGICDNCEYFDDTEAGTGDSWGSCRVRAPVMMPEFTRAVFPIVSKFMWCGEFKKCEFAESEVTK